MFSPHPTITTVSSWTMAYPNDSILPRNQVIVLTAAGRPLLSRPKSLSLNIAFTNYAHIYYRIPNRHEPLPPKHNRYTNPFRLYNADVFKCLSDSSTARSHSCMRILQRRQWLVFNTMALDPGHMNRVGDTMLILFRSFARFEAPTYLLGSPWQIYS
ncbi:uncharacterized protein F5891DRAFT_259706 [Suillus fuscotomentosus]|uniref:Uncharacterized protein n=1 Tax=Suillus fuscotomentosus TaxID=1912939 RepID=A0AAD4DNX3_9AGAM|nr:uncharacterized protein F5891DRAFT_259706 [Suillus fuscotomentosus]KAG1887402.1 hypothetical protein F5891DRAFT_259706 [Suillus fuscotomentosus]